MSNQNNSEFFFAFPFPDIEMWGNQKAASETEKGLLGKPTKNHNIQPVKLSFMAMKVSLCKRSWALRGRLIFRVLVEETGLMAQSIRSLPCKHKDLRYCFPGTCGNVHGSKNVRKDALSSNPNTGEAEAEDSWTHWPDHRASLVSGRSKEEPVWRKVGMVTEGSTWSGFSLSSFSQHQAWWEVLSMEQI